MNFFAYADIIKISDEELEFITGYTDIKDALDGLFANRAKYVIYTKGADGAENLYKERFRYRSTWIQN